jgi:hypothetical protein
MTLTLGNILLALAAVVLLLAGFDVATVGDNALLVGLGLGALGLAADGAHVGHTHT